MTTSFGAEICGTLACVAKCHGASAQCDSYEVIRMTHIKLSILTPNPCKSFKIISTTESKKGRLLSAEVNKIT